MKTIEQRYQEQEQEMLEDFFTYLRFPSISSEPEHRDDVLACADWLISYLEKMSFEVQLWETSGHPTIFATHLHAGPDKPTILIYNHYDVQPIDPIEEWESPPFEPTIKDGEIFARGACDNKGNNFYVIQALKLLLERDGSLPVNIKLCIEGEEEIASPGLTSLLKDKQEQLRADHLAIVDLGIKGPNIPAITLGTRGAVKMTVDIYGPKQDLHSGSHGGIACNPIHILTKLLATLHNDEGAITVPGFYDDVKEISESDKKRLSFTFDEEQYRKTFGPPSGGEKKYSPLERNWIRPTLEINGIAGGYAGEGFKTVIPAKATANISCRLVPDQDPQDIGKKVSAFLKERCPDDVTIEITIHPGTGKAMRSSPSSITAQAFAQAYEKVLEKSCEYLFNGGSIPIVPELAKASQASVVMIGYGLPNDNVHAPNEHFSINRLQQGCLTIAQALKILGA